MESANRGMEMKASQMAHPASTTDGGSVAVLERAPAWHDQAYRAAAGDISKIRWALGRPNPLLVSWLNAEAPGRIRPGARTVVVGCGLGDDVVALIDRGYDAVGFDVSTTAIEWARRRFPQHPEAFLTADLLNLPSRMQHRFDLVIESYTLESIDPGRREQAARALAMLACPRGMVVAVTRARDEHELLEHVQGPPWPLSPSELGGLMEAAGMQPTRPLDDFFDEETPPVRRLRGSFVHA